MIRTTDLTLRRGPRVLLDRASFVVHPGERVGVVGRNGCGKSSLFALIRGLIDADAGRIDLPETWRLSWVEQEIPDRHKPAREHVIDGDQQLRALEIKRKALDMLEHHEGNADEIGHRIAEAEAALIDADAWSAPARAEQLLAGLGFTPEQWLQPVGTFSGGWQMRINLARALMAPSDLLLLDEPTNHLDLDAMLWLERWLDTYTGTVLLISHDTEFLDAVARTILHIDQSVITRYKGGYDDFVQQRAERLKQVRQAHDRQSRETARMQHFIDRFKATASKAKQAQSRVKALARMQELAPILAESAIDISIPSPTHMPDPLVALDHANMGYAADPMVPGSQDITILHDVNLRIPAGARIGVLGINGAGKSTLIKTIAGQLTPVKGQVIDAKGLVVGYFAQHQLDTLDIQSTPLQHLMRIAPDTREQLLRNYLGRFGFSGDRVNEVIEPFSGGEKARLALALVVWHKPNLLVLDEPSNHLDVETREALTAALAEYEGGMLLVSHDRHLLRTTVDEFWLVSKGEAKPFDGDLEDYRTYVVQNQGAENKRSPKIGNGEGVDGLNTNNDVQNGADAKSVSALDASERKQQKREDAQRRRALSDQRKPIEQSLKQLEQVISLETQALNDLNRRMAEPHFYSESNKEAQRDATLLHSTLKQSLEQTESRWLALQEELEALSVK